MCCSCMCGTNRQPVISTSHVCANFGSQTLFSVVSSFSYSVAVLLLRRASRRLPMCIQTPPQHQYSVGTLFGVPLPPRYSIPEYLFYLRNPVAALFVDLALFKLLVPTTTAAQADRRPDSPREAAQRRSSVDEGRTDHGRQVLPGRQAGVRQHRRARWPQGGLPHGSGARKTRSASTGVLEKVFNEG